MPPAPTESHADRHPVARLPVDVGRLADAGDEQPDAVTGEHRFDVVDRIHRHGALGQHHHVDDVDLVERGAQHAVEQLEVEPVVRRELEEAERLTTLALDRAARGRKSLSRIRNGHGNSKTLAGRRRGSWSGRWAGTLCHTASTPGPRTQA